MLAWVQERERARLAERGQQDPQPAALPPAEERARIARELRFPTSRGPEPRPNSPAAVPDQSRPELRAASEGAAAFQRHDRGAFDSDYSGSLTSHSEAAGHLALPQRGFTVASRENGHHDRFKGHSSAADSESEDERPQSRSSELSHAHREAQRVLAESKARRLQTASMRALPQDSYPSTTSGRSSTIQAAPARTESPQLVHPSPSLHQQKPSEASTTGNYREAYMKQAAENYQRQHPQQHDPLERPVVTTQKPSETVPLQQFPAPTSYSDPVAAEEQPIPVEEPRQQHGQQPLLPLLPSRNQDELPPTQPHPTLQNLSAHLDYDLETLHALTFSSLEAEPFDYNPDAPRDAGEDMTQSTPLLSSRLLAAMSQDKDSQRAMLAGIPQAQWSSIDDWFTKEFAALAAARTAKRSERREMAAALELRIASRFGDVDAERESLREALRGMRRSGADVLKAGTPTPKKRKAIGSKAEKR